MDGPSCMVLTEAEVRGQRGVRDENGTSVVEEPA